MKLLDAQSFELLKKDLDDDIAKDEAKLKELRLKLEEFNKSKESKQLSDIEQQEKEELSNMKKHATKSSLEFTKEVSNFIKLKNEFQEEADKAKKNW
ncbi:hypothetical protein ['Camptotheca acuminata' phytoplasma]|uniref:hypothetical protein n=1 Tax='Camptotheca acuminata' phytoplasma TaxID=3239192 RepID=UPI003519FF36